MRNWRLWLSACLVAGLSIPDLIPPLAGLGCPPLAGLGCPPLAGLGWTSSASLHADETGQTEQSAASRDKENEKRFEESAARYELLIGAEGKRLERIPRPILSWSNPLRKTTAGALFLWTDDKRPAVAMCIYPNGNDAYDHEFQSLAPLQVIATVDKRPQWGPAEPGIRYSRLASPTAPAETPSRRLRQMRNMARTFSATVGAADKPGKPLRLLTSPLYRYPAEAANDRVIDGVLFAFVQGTDPEVLLLIEAVKGDTKEAVPHWRYALARMSMVPLQVHLASRPVWERKWASGRATSSYYTIHAPAE